ncbi:MAG TPA: MOSC N-terminal beta barrel domain-containing protein [Ktedonobacterales bacterium]|jgi:MOSC domain-containing protein|nr:MOSC N-terminal beta barrel domain-containing protein [Ktedonobacterales bacterium]
MTEALANVVGFIRAIHRFPVKSMRGESLEAADVEWQGLHADRRYAFVQADDRSVFPYLTAREAPDLLRYTPHFVETGRPGNLRLMVRTPEGLDYGIVSEDLHASIALRYPRPFYLLRLGLTGMPDIAPISVMTTSTVTSLGKALGMTLDPLRFRQNILIETPDGEPYPEDQWVGQTLIFGEDEVRVHVSEKDNRCKMITLDPQTATAEPRVLEEVVRTRGGNLGVYGLPLRLGMLRVGQTVRLMSH